MPTDNVDWFDDHIGCPTNDDTTQYTGTLKELLAKPCLVDTDGYVSYNNLPIGHISTQYGMFAPMFCLFDNCIAKSLPPTPTYQLAVDSILNHYLDWKLQQHVKAK